MIAISLCMIVKDEEAMLARCLDSVCGLFEEIIIVDTGSRDRTREIAARYTDHIYAYEWQDDFAAARNFAFSKATQPYCMWLDADDLLPEEERAHLLDLKATLSDDIDVVMMRYHTAFDADGQPTFSYYRERIIRNLGNNPWCGAVHEAIAPFGRILYSEIAIHHRKECPSDPDRNLRIYERMAAEGRPFDPRAQFYFARELCDHTRWSEAIPLLEHYLGDGKGWIENQLEACRLLSRCYNRCGDSKTALRTLLHALELAPPRAGLCCDLGQYFLGKKRYAQAIFWYELALTRDPREQVGGFCNPEEYGYLPCIQLCVCYDQLGDHRTAARFNERAAGFRPDSPAVAHNRRYFVALREDG